MEWLERAYIVLCFLSTSSIIKHNKYHYQDQPKQAEERVKYEGEEKIGGRQHQASPLQ